MTPTRILALAAVCAALGATGAFAAPPVAVRATIESVSGDTLAVRAHTGETETVKLTPTTRFTRVARATLADVKPGRFIGVAGMPISDGVQKALEVHIFPEAMRGVGEGFRPFDLRPGSTMTNGNVDARVESVDGPKLTVAYKGGHQIIVVDAKTPIVAVAPGAPADLKVGAAIIARGVETAKGTYDAAYVLVGVDGVVPPM